jgi:hypothetical protein
LTAAGAFVERHPDHFADDISDEGWLPVVGAKGWVVLTNDKRIRHRRIECQALLAAGIRAFVLTAGHLSSAAAAEIWVRQLPKIERLAALVAIWREFATSPEDLATQGLEFLRAKTAEFYGT